MQTERVTFLTSRDHKAALDTFAASSGQSVGQVLREASSRYIAEGQRTQEEELAALVNELSATVPVMRASLKRSTKRIHETMREVDAMLRDAGIRK